MAFYETRELICENINQYFQHYLRERGLITLDIVAQRNQIISSVKDVYSMALLMKNSPKEEAPTFSNIQTTYFTYLIRDNLEQIFETLGWATTQKEASRIASSLRRRSFSELLSDKQKKALEDMEIFQDSIKAITEWIIRARNIVVTMTANFPLLQSVTEEEKEFAKELNFDWYYDYSDDINVWRSGKERHAKKVGEITALLAQKPHLLKVVEVVAKAHGIPTKFFTELR